MSTASFPRAAGQNGRGEKIIRKNMHDLAFCPSFSAKRTSLPLTFRALRFTFLVHLIFQTTKSCIFRTFLRVLPKCNLLLLRKCAIISTRIGTGLCNSPHRRVSSRKNADFPRFSFLSVTKRRRPDRRTESHCEKGYPFSHTALPLEAPRRAPGARDVRKAFWAHTIHTSF